MRSAALTAGVAVLLTASGLAGQTGAEDLEGAWLVVEVVTTGPSARTISSPQPGLLLFTGGHYSYTLINGDEPRPGLPPGVASAEALLMAWNPFSANAGTYEISGDRMIRRPIVAKDPNAMAPGAYNEYTFRMSADTLWVTTVGTEAGPARNPQTVRYVRER
jgi:hypothetical protein